MKIHKYHHQERLTLESGEELPQYTLAYTTIGSMLDDQSNVVWIVHALTANSDPTEWWPGVVGEGLAIDPERHFIICANVLGSHYGSTSPLDINPETDEPYYHDFPLLTIKDLAITYEHLANHLNITKINLLVGPSMGGQQAMEWALITKLQIKNLMLIATNARHSAYGIAFNESQRMAIEIDPTWYLNKPDAGINGMGVARATALLSYRSPQGYQISQTDQNSEKIEAFRATTYQKYQGEKLKKRFNAFSYYTFTKAMDSHNVGRGWKGTGDALSRIRAERCIVIGITSDHLFTIQDARELAEHIPNSSLIEIESHFGHDGFLTESHQMAEIIKSIL